MSGRILLVDDEPVNLRLLEARLAAEYYTTLRARTGEEALAACATNAVDCVILDVLMPGMDGFETCRRIKSDPDTAHIPVILVTALDRQEDRLKGLDAGADDFLSKPVQDLPLLARIRSVLRLKQATDELRARADTVAGLRAEARMEVKANPDIALLSGDARLSAKVASALRGCGRVACEDDVDRFASTTTRGADMAIIDLTASAPAAMRLVSLLRTQPATRNLPILAITRGDDETLSAKALELGVNDLVHAPIERNELVLRTRTQLRRADYEAQLRRLLDDTLRMAFADALTGLHNRRFFETHLARALTRTDPREKRLAVIMIDLDRFKAINDEHGHEAGDRILRAFAERLGTSVRPSDLACRYGGEEFAILMDDADEQTGLAVAERVRGVLVREPIDVDGVAHRLTASMGVAVLDKADNGLSLVRRADEALYRAKRMGRDRIELAATDRQDGALGGDGRTQAG